MSAKNSYTTSDYIEWNTAVNLVHRLYKDKDYKMSLLIGCGIFFGLRISDILQLSWDMLLDEPSFELIEKKTQKRREVRINKGFQSTFGIVIMHFSLLISRKNASRVGNIEFILFKE